MKKDKKDIFQIVKAVIDEMDAAYLRRDGAPDDEYDLESYEIAKRIDESSGVDEIEAAIENVWLQYFGNYSRLKDYKVYAEKIYRSIKNE